VTTDHGDDVFHEFFAYLGADKGLSHASISAYSSDFDQFRVFCRVKSWDIFELKSKQVRQFLAHLSKNGMSERSIARKLSTLKQFYVFLMREDLLKSDPTELVSVRVKARKLPKLLKKEEMIQLIESVCGKNEKEVRDRALLELWYASGCRVSEITKLQISDIDFQDGWIRVLGKGRRYRQIPVHATALEWCLKYREIRHGWLMEHSLKETEKFFLTRRGKGFTRQGIWRLLKDAAKMAGMSDKIHPHMIRHSFATHVLCGGADLRAVQEMLGHRSIGTTEIYTHLDIENLKIMQLKYHPRS